MPDSNMTKLPSQRYHEVVAFKPLGTRVVLVIEDADLQRTPLGLYMPSKDREKPLQGRAVEVGRDVSEIAVGDLVLFERYCGAPIESSGKPPILILDESDVMAIVEKGGFYANRKDRAIIEAAYNYIRHPGDDPSDWRESFAQLKNAVEQGICEIEQNMGKGIIK